MSDRFGEEKRGSLMTEKKQILAGMLGLLFTLFAVIDLPACGRMSKVEQKEATEQSVQEFMGKRIREDQIIAYRDKGIVEFYYHLPEKSDPVFIQVEIVLGDGGYALTDPLEVQPGDTMTVAPTREGEGFTPFVPGVYGGRILVFSPEGKVVDRVGQLECRLYESWLDPYDTVKETEPPPIEIDPAESEYRPEFYSMILDMNTCEISAGLYSLRTEARNLDIDVYVNVGNQEYLVASIKEVKPKSIYTYFYADQTVADQLKADTVYEARVEFRYSDTGEVYEITKGEIKTQK